MKCHLCDGKVIKVFKPVDVPNKEIKFKKFFHKCVYCGGHFYFITNLNELAEKVFKGKLV
jgi:uncharacterized protein with PIN domain